MRLVNGYTDAEGRVEIMEGDGTWSTVASSVANVAGAPSLRRACTWLTAPPRPTAGMRRRLGLGRRTGRVPPPRFAGAVAADCCALYGMGTGPIRFSGMQCTGGEADLVECPMRPGPCWHGEDAGVRCMPGRRRPPRFRPRRRRCRFRPRRRQRRQALRPRRSRASTSAGLRIARANARLASARRGRSSFEALPCDVRLRLSCVPPAPPMAPPAPPMAPPPAPPMAPPPCENTKSASWCAEKDCTKDKSQTRSAARTAAPARRET